MLCKIASGEELDDVEKINVSKQWISDKKNSMIFAEMLHGEDISMEEKIEIARWLIADNVADILQKEMIISHVSGEKSELTLKASECKDSDENLRKFLIILWAKDIQVSSRFPDYTENYEGRTTIEFKY